MRPVQGICRLEGRWPWIIAGCLLLIVANLVRSWNAFSHIAFYAEDAVLFSHYYGNTQPLVDVGRHFFGQPYITLITSFFAWVIAYFDVRIQPYLYLWSGFFWGTAAACCFFCSGLIRSRTVLLLGPLLMGLVALNHIFYYNTLIFIMYTGLAVLLALFFYPPPKTIIGTLIYLILFLFLPWSGPYSTLVVPVSLLFIVLFWRDLEKKRYLLLLSFFSALCYYITISSNTTKIMRIQRLEVIQHYFDSLLDRIIFFDLFGYVPPWFWLPVLLVIGGGFVHFRKDTEFVKNSLIMFAIISGSFAIFYLSSKYPVYIRPKPCHRFISLFFWSIYLLYLVDHFFLVYGGRKVLSVVFSMSICLIIVFDNLNFPDKRKIDAIPDTVAYVAAIHTMEQQDFKKKNQYVIMRQVNYQHPFFHPWVRVGSSHSDAQQLIYQDLPVPLQSYFVSQLIERRKGDLNVQ